MAERVEELCMDCIGYGKRTVPGQRRLLGTPESVNVVEALVVVISSWLFIIVTTSLHMVNNYLIYIHIYISQSV